MTTREQKQRKDKVLNDSILTKEAKVRCLVSIGFGTYEATMIVDEYQPQPQPQPQPQVEMVQPQVVDWANNGLNFGVEIECILPNGTEIERVSGSTLHVERYNHDTKNYFKVVNDGSLRANYGEQGREIVSPILTGRGGLNMLKEVCEKLKQMNAKVNRTCGLHIHIGAENFDLTTLKNICVNYTFLEPSIRTILSPSRRENQYCKNFDGNDLAMINSSNDQHSIYRGLVRYKAVNLTALARHGTIEFRQHQGSTDYDKIEGWLKFLYELIEFSRENRLTEHVHNFNVPFLSDETREYIRKRVAALSLDSL